MSEQTRALGGTTGSPTSSFGAGTDYVSPVTPNTTGSNVTGALTGSTSARPILITSLTVGMRTGTTTTYQIQLATANTGGGGWQSGNLSGGGNKTDAPYIATYTGTTFYYGFQIQSSGTTNWYRGGSGDIYRDGTVDSNYAGTNIYGSITWQTVPSAPTSATYSSLLANSVTLSWGSPSDTAGGVTDYRVFRYSAAAGYEFLGQTGGATSMNVTGLVASRSYTFYIAAINDVCSYFPGAYSDTATHVGTNATVSLTTPSGVPAPGAIADYFGTGKVNQAYSSSNGYAYSSDATSMSSSGQPSWATNSATQSGAYFYVTGTPSSAGTYSFNITGTNETSSTSGSVSITINPLTPPVWEDNSLSSSFIVGTDYATSSGGNNSVSASNTPTYTVTSGSLPSGISLSGGTLVGTPTTKQTYSFTITAANTDGQVTATFSGNVTAPPVWTDTTLANIVKDVAYSDGVNATNSPTYTISAGTLPTGLTLSSSTGAITGTPTGTGAYSFTVQAQNVDGTITQAFSGTIKQPPAWTDQSLGGFVENNEYSDSVIATNTPTYSYTGTLPTGITFTAGTGTFAGTPTVLNEAYNFTAKAENADGFVTATFSGTVQPDLGGIIRVYSGSAWSTSGEVYVYDGSTWVLGKAYVYNGNIWSKTLY